MFRRCSYMRSALLMSSVPILHVLCSRRYTAVTVSREVVVECLADVHDH